MLKPEVPKMQTQGRWTQRGWPARNRHSALTLQARGDQTEKGAAQGNERLSRREDGSCREETLRKEGGHLTEHNGDGFRQSTPGFLTVWKPQPPRPLGNAPSHGIPDPLDLMKHLNKYYVPVATLV